MGLIVQADFPNICGSGLDTYRHLGDTYSYCSVELILGVEAAAFLLFKYEFLGDT